MGLNWIARRSICFLRLIAIPLFLWSCEEKIEVALKSENSKIVIESYITNSQNPIIVKLSKSQEFFNQSAFVPIESASVQIETQSITDQLSDDGGGYYISKRMEGMPGKDYTLIVATDGRQFGATVQVPYNVPIDTVYFQPGVFEKDSLNAIIGFRDPPNTENYYRIKIYCNRKVAINDYFLITDAFSDGAEMVVPIYYRYFAPGDTIAVELLNLERNTWKYFKGLRESIQQGINSQAPGNPPSNLSNGALGIFGAYSSTTWLGIVP